MLLSPSSALHALYAAAATTAVFPSGYVYHNCDFPGYFRRCCPQHQQDGGSGYGAGREAGSSGGHGSTHGRKFSRPSEPPSNEWALVAHLQKLYTATDITNVWAVIDAVNGGDVSYFAPVPRCFITRHFAFKRPVSVNMGTVRCLAQLTLDPPPVLLLL